MNTRNQVVLKNFTSIFVEMQELHAKVKKKEKTEPKGKNYPVTNDYFGTCGYLGTDQFQVKLLGKQRSVFEFLKKQMIQAKVLN
jgi:hypothetical protein